MRTFQDPYRGFTSRELSCPASDPLEPAVRAARFFVVSWSILRMTACVVRGLEFEGLLAALIVGVTLSFRARSLIP